MRGLPLLAILCAGCSIGRSDVAEKARTALIGAPKSEILQCAGVPDRTMVQDRVEYMTYDNEQTGQSGLTLPIIGGGINLVGDEYCRTTFAMVDGRVRSLSYAGNTGNMLGSLAMCGFTVATCVDDRKKEKAAMERPH
ncbi:MAG TPA: hypothetical protein VKZ79_23380 [Alphaproteobacteria bacterium]|nr:hypothetical protein [Alphaproteobacteria bacterium]